ncbi:hypothetical protein VP01_889g10 [Puccinia sorghi]|uniref:Uncharacterized protein n=1 Tax=Puccinia sorghi TaxID=27349 RepID=A0A0L6UAA9_9BASI|nr:hypothetical protein VP01_889g10 [Puccinia sorghi]
MITMSNILKPLIEKLLLKLCARLARNQRTFPWKITRRTSRHISVAFMEGSNDNQCQINSIQTVWVNNVVLGMIHNWYEGVLQHHFQIRWGFNAKAKTPYSNSSTNENSNSDDLRDKNSTLTITEKTNLQQLLPTFISPPGIASVPKGVETESNGKLKASEFHSVFAEHLPLVALEDFGSACLIEFTHFFESRLITEESCAKFYINYKFYCRTSEPLFQEISIWPNHHYALQISQLSQKFVPLINLSEFGGERLNGMLQSFSAKNLLGKRFARCNTDEVKELNGLIQVCSTTGQTGQMEGSMIKCFCKIQQLAHKKEFSKLGTTLPNKDVNNHLTLEI